MLLTRPPFRLVYRDFWRLPPGDEVVSMDIVCHPGLHPQPAAQVRRPGHTISAISASTWTVSRRGQAKMFGRPSRLRTPVTESSSRDPFALRQLPRRS